MKAVLFGWIMLAGTFAWSQDTTNLLNQYQWADSIFGNLTNEIPTGKLLNRLVEQDTQDMVTWNTGLFHIDSINNPAMADHYYGLLYEMKLMSFDTASVPDRITVFDSVSTYMGRIEYENERYYYPIGIADMRYNVLDVNGNLNAGTIRTEL